MLNTPSLRALLALLALLTLLTPALSSADDADDDDAPVIKPDPFDGLFEEDVCFAKANDGKGSARVACHVRNNLNCKSWLAITRVGEPLRPDEDPTDLISLDVPTNCELAGVANALRDELAAVPGPWLHLSPLKHSTRASKGKHTADRWAYGSISGLSIERQGDKISLIDTPYDGKPTTLQSAEVPDHLTISSVAFEEDTQTFIAIGHQGTDHGAENLFAITLRRSGVAIHALSPYPL